MLLILVRLFNYSSMQITYIAYKKKRRALSKLSMCLMKTLSHSISTLIINFNNFRIAYT